uniref:Uncharacterized protein n=1 Tax=Anguilla anguilla TaxID=7936 RepID=A0A0E9RYL8_ANGAN
MGGGPSCVYIYIHIVLLQNFVKSMRVKMRALKTETRSGAKIGT